MTQAWVRNLVSLVLRQVMGSAFEQHSELSVVFTGDAEMRRLNRRYRGKIERQMYCPFP